MNASGGTAVKKLSRLGNEMHLSAAIAVADLTPGHYESGIVLMLLLRCCASDWIDGDQLRRPRSPTRSSSINALAASLLKPYSTTHRHVKRLIELGWVVETDKGVTVSHTSRTEKGIVSFLTAAHDSMIRLVEDLRTDMILPSADRPPTPDLRLKTVVAALDIWLVPYEYAAEPVTDWTSKFVWAAIIVANVRRITTDPVLSDRYAFAPTPDFLREPINVPSLVRLTGFSYGTVYRHCLVLAEKDVIQYERGGWLLVSRQLGIEQVDQGVHALLDYFRKRIVELVVDGFDPPDAGRFYIAKRARYVPIGV